MRIQADLAGFINTSSAESPTRQISKTLERLSKGLRINRASDDAAGLSVSETMRAQVRGLTRAKNNVHEAQALFRVQEGILGSMQNQIQRLRELAIQSASATLTDRERSYLQREADQILANLNNASRQKTWLNGFAMDDSSNDIVVTNQVAGGAVPFDIRIKPFDPNTFANYVDRPIRIDIIQDATAQQLDTVAERSSHIRETLLAPMASSTTLIGTALPADLSTINYTTTINDPLNAITQVRRRHDNVLINPADYTLLSAVPIGELTAFQVKINNPAVMTFTVNNETRLTNAVTGNATFSFPGCDVTALNQVRSTSHAQEFLADADGIVTLASGPLTTVNRVEVWNGAAWTSLQSLAVGNAGDLVYEWDTANTVTVGIKQLDGTLAATGPQDVRVLATLAAAVPIAEFASAADGAVAYQWDGNRVLTLGIKHGAVLQKGAHRIFIAYSANENQYNLTYSSTNKYRLAQGVRDASNFVQFAGDLYAGTDIPADLTGSRRMEVRINGSAPEADYQFMPLIDGQRNVVVFKTGAAVAGIRTATGPVAGASVTVDYATPTGTAVTWGGTGTRLGETTNNDGSITVGEAAAQNGLFNDFWAGMSSTAFTVNQPNRNQSMTLTLQPSWTVQDLIDNFNASAMLNDVEALAYWDGASAEVRIRPGTSGWKERPVEGWEGSLFTLTVSTANVGAGSAGDRPADQNSLTAIETAAPQDSIIRVTMADTGEVIEAANVSRSNEHTIASLGIRVSVKSDAPVGASSTLQVQSFIIQAGAYGVDSNQIRFSIPDVTPAALGTDRISLETQARALSSIDYAGEAITQLSSVRGYLGSLMNRCDRAIELLQTGMVRGQESESVIRDANMAEEMTQLTKAQICQQSAFALQAKSNLFRKNMYSLMVP